MPSAIADLRIMLSPNADPIASALSAARFLRLVRGLPLDEIEVECGEKIYRIIAKNNGKCYALLKKPCYVGEEDAELFGCRVRVKNIRTDFGVVRLVKAESLLGFSEEALRSLCLSQEGGDVIGAVAFEAEGEKITAKHSFSRNRGFLPPLLAAEVAASYSIEPFEEISVTVGELEFFFLRSQGRMLVSDRQPRPLTLYAPNIT